jgi:hypothetical protein
MQGWSPVSQYSSLDSGGWAMAALDRQAMIIIRHNQNNALIDSMIRVLK